MGNDTELHGRMGSARPSTSSLTAVLDRILDKGIVVDLQARLSLVGTRTVFVEARVTVGSVDTFLHYAKEIAEIEADEYDNNQLQA